MSGVLSLSPTSHQALTLSRSGTKTPESKVKKSSFLKTATCELTSSLLESETRGSRPSSVLFWLATGAMSEMRRRETFANRSSRQVFLGYHSGGGTDDLFRMPRFSQRMPQGAQ